QVTKVCFNSICDHVLASTTMNPTALTVEIQCSYVTVTQPCGGICLLNIGTQAHYSVEFDRIRLAHHRTEESTSFECVELVWVALHTDHCACFISNFRQCRQICRRGHACFIDLQHVARVNFYAQHRCISGAISDDSAPAIGQRR